MMERRKEWTTKLAATAHIAHPTFQTLVHDMPRLFDPGNSDHLRELERANAVYIQGMRIQRVTWLKKHSRLEKAAGSLIVWFEQVETAGKAIAKGMIWKYELKAREIFR